MAFFTFDFEAWKLIVSFHQNLSPFSIDYFNHFISQILTNDEKCQIYKAPIIQVLAEPPYITGNFG